MARGATAPAREQERSRVMKRKLLDATLECLAELGYVGATMDKVVAKAGVSRGAQVHHFPTKSLLMQAAMARMLDLLIQDLHQQTALIREHKKRPATVFRYLWERYFSSSLFSVTIELIVASRTDIELCAALAPVTERFHQQIDDCFYLLCRGTDYDEPQLIVAVNLTMCLLRGMGVQTVLFDRPEYFKNMLDEWFLIIERMIEPAATSDVLASKNAA